MFMMKKIIHSILLIFTCLILISPIATKADSGWDSSYDSGGWDSGSSWDSGGYDIGGYSSHHSSSSGTGLGPIADIVLILMILPIIVVETIKKRNKYKGIPPIKNPALESIEKNKKPFKIGKNKHSNIQYNDIEQSKINKIDPNISIEEFKKKAFNIYKDIQEAWMNFDTDKIRKLTTDEIYNMYSSQLETLKLKNQKNIMKNIEYVDAKIINITNVSGVITINVYLRVKVLDYVINVKTNKTVRGIDNARLDIEYNLTFVKSETDDKKIETCPNCGAPVDIISSATCPYCDSTLVKNASDYVMSKKTCIGQRLDI